MAGELTTLGLARGMGIVKFVPGYPYQNPEAAALVARFATEPDDARKALIDSQWTALKASSFLAKLDALWVHAAHGPEAARLNWLGDFYNCLPINNPTFTVDRGYMGNGSSSYLDTQFDPVTAASPKFQRNSGSLGIRSNTENTGVGSLAGFYNTPTNRGTTINPRVSSMTSFATYRVTCDTNAVQTPNNSVMSSVGLFVANRVDPNGVRGYREGSLLVSGTQQPSFDAPSGNFRLGSINDSSFRACQFSMGFIGGGMTDQEVIDIYNWFEPYRIAVGVT